MHIIHNMPSNKWHIIIIGGGVAGLTAALHLAERGLKPLLLEAHPSQIGGRLAGTGEVIVGGQPFPLEHGVHGLWDGYIHLKHMLARHNLLPELIPAREEEWIYRSGSFIGRSPIGSTIRNSLLPAPFHYLQLFVKPSFLWTIDWRDWLSLLHVWSVLIMAVGVDPFGENQPLSGENLGRALRRWGPAIRALFVGLTRNGMSTHPDNVPLAGFLAFLRFYTVLRRRAWAFSYLPQGGGPLCEALAARITALGGEIHPGVRLHHLKKDGEDWRLEVDSAKGSLTLHSQFVLLATDSPNAAAIIKGSFPAESENLFFPQGMENAVIHLWFGRKPRRAHEAGIFSGDFQMHNFFWLDRLYEPYRNWSDQTGGSCIEVHIYGPPEALAQPDALLITQVLNEFYKAHPDLKGALLGQHLQRNAASHTLPALGERGSHLGIETPWPGLLCAGDWVQDPAPCFFLERACFTGLKAANAILQASGQPAFETLPYPAAEPLAGWIENLMRRGRENIRKRKKGASHEREPADPTIER